MNGNMRNMGKKLVTNLKPLCRDDPEAAAGELVCCNAVQFDALAFGPFCECFVLLHGERDSVVF